jgi:hypothetical protein
MVEISMGQDDQLKIAWLAARPFQFSEEIGAAIRIPRVDQDEPGVGVYEIAVYATKTIR